MPVRELCAHMSRIAILQHRELRELTQLQPPIKLEIPWELLIRNRRPLLLRSVILNRSLSCIRHIRLSRCSGVEHIRQYTGQDPLHYSRCCRYEHIIRLVVVNKCPSIYLRDENAQVLNQLSRRDRSTPID